jgi:transposase InsO family protein
VPKYTVSDQGSEFGEEYREWCEDHEVRARFGAVGRHGSIAVEERFYAKLAIMRSMPPSLSNSPTGQSWARMRPGSA